MTDTAEPQHFDSGECPECFLVLVGEIAANTGNSIVGPYDAASSPTDQGSSQFSVGSRDHLTWFGVLRRNK